MSTNANISVKIGGIYKTIYLHWDGYPDTALVTLKAHYGNYNSAEALVKMGDISELHEKINPTEGSEHTFEKAEKGVCVFYTRDRGESGCGYTKGTSPAKDQEYNYVFEEGEWSQV